MFPVFEKRRPSIETDANKKTFHQSLGCFAKTVFIVFTDGDVSKCQCATNNVSSLTT
jgi:hypothetical protein